MYYEAGFAKGLGKTVILACREDYFQADTHGADPAKGVHFDTAHQNFIVWSDPENLRLQLRARIEATVPRTVSGSE